MSNGAGCDLDCELSVPEVTCCGNTLSVIVTSARPIASLPKSYYAQLYYVDSHRPWVMRKRISSYRYIASAAQQSNASEESTRRKCVAFRHCSTPTVQVQSAFTHWPRRKTRSLVREQRCDNLFSKRRKRVSRWRWSEHKRWRSCDETVQCPVDGDEFDVAGQLQQRG